MLNQYEKLKDILREMFQMDQADLDFGIYRIMNAKREEIEKFLDEELLPQIKEKFVQYRGTEIEEKKKEIVKLEATLRDSGMNPDEAPKVKVLREEVAKYGDDEALENEVFSHLSSFFRRYYDNGDFLSLRRYKKDTYAIPYEGEEVKLHWANADQYYIKTSEYLRDYAFKLPEGKRAHFKLVDATQEKDNIKTEAGKERKFRLHEEEPIRIEGNELIIQFVYLPEKEKQESLNKKTIETLTAEFGEKLKDFTEIFTPAPTDKNPKRTLLEKHLFSYTARFNFDFFIHKDLGSFLRRELDFYIKNEVLFVDDLDAQDEKKLKSTVAKVKVIKHIAQKIITFLAQLEDFQKKLWLKKKFVVACGYCVTLDRVPEALYPEIAKNDAQREEWIKLFAIDEIKADLSKPGYTSPLTVEFLKANPHLVLDTKHFDEKFKERFLASFDNLDATCDGVIINSENFQALNLLSEKYREKVKCVYIDPPYNAPSSEIIYKNNYKHSSWLSLMCDRLLKGKLMLINDFVHIVAIDEVEQEVLGQVISQVFSENKKVCVSVVHNPRGQQGKNVSYTHDFAYFIYPTDAKKYISETKRNEIDSRNLRDSGTESNRTDAKTCFYPFIIKNNKIIDIGVVPEDTFHPQEANIKGKNESIEIWPIDESSAEKKWRYSVNTVRNILEKLEIKEGRSALQVIFNKDTGIMRTVWADSQYDASEYGTKVLQDLLGNQTAALFTYPKSIYTVKECVYAGLNNVADAIVLDYFAGSGTTAHAVINLNRENESKCKYILVEMGEYFDSVLKPRVQKVVYSKKWEAGKPLLREGISHMFKYMKLEGYDDTLDNLMAVLSNSQQKTLEEMGAQAREDYLLSYALDIETKASDSLLNIDRFTDPFNYTLKIRKDNELKDQQVDLVETFNYLIGLYVEQIETIREYKVVRGKLRTGEKTLVIWRNTKDKSNEDLDEFFKKQKYNTLDFEFDLIFVNGDNNLENLKVAEDKWKVNLIEEEFVKRMFDNKEN